MENKSIWLDGISSDYQKLDKDLDLDVLIIGGGISGMSCGYHLRNSNLKVALVEANLVGRGVTSKTTGKLTYLQENIYSKIAKYVGEDKANLYYKSQKDAIDIVESIVRDEKIDCSLEKVKSYTFTDNPNKITALREEKKRLESFGAKVFEDVELPDGEKNKYCIYVSDTFVFHPLKYVESLKKIISKNIDIYEDSRIINIEKTKDYYICKTKENTIKAKKVIIASHYTYFLLPFLMPFKVTLERSYVGAFRVDDTLGFSAINIDKPCKSMRYHSNGCDKYKIFLYGSHNICVKNNELDNFSKLKELPFDYDYLWSNIDVITGDYLPFIGKIDDSLFLATGYNTWGMTNGSLAGKVISDMILGINNPYIELFNPRRGVNMGRVIQFPVILGSTIKSFVGSKINKDKSWYSDNIKCSTKDGKSVYIYTDDLGEEHIVYTKCPHLKCNLIFNEEEKTWDCPCHGSRFNIDGICIDGPSNYNIGYKEKEE